MTTKKMNLALFAQMARTLIELRKENRGHFCVCLFLLLFFSGPAVLAQTKADLFIQALADPINAGNDATIEVQVSESGSFSATGPVYVVLNEIKYSGSISDVLVAGTDTVLKTKLFGLKVRHFNNPCLLIAFTRSIHALFSM